METVRSGGATPQIRLPDHILIPLAFLSLASDVSGAFSFSEEEKIMKTIFTLAVVTAGQVIGEIIDLVIERLRKSAGSPS